MFHPYQKGYSTLPQLEKLPECEPPFYCDEDYEYFIRQKYIAEATRRVEFIHDCDKEIIYTITNFIKDQAEWVEAYSLFSIAFQIQEDIAIHRIKDGKDWLAYANICFPSSWRPEEKIGRSFAEIHAPVAGMNLSNSYKLAEAASQRGPFKRFVWSPIFEYKINFHPDNPKKKFDPDNPFIKVKVERQITWPFPELNCFLFIIRQYIVDPILPALYDACLGMTDEQKRYKEIDDNFLNYLKIAIDK